MEPVVIILKSGAVIHALGWHPRDHEFPDTYLLDHGNGRLTVVEADQVAAVTISAELAIEYLSANPRDHLPAALLPRGLPTAPGSRL